MKVGEASITPSSLSEDTSLVSPTDRGNEFNSSSSSFSFSNSQIRES